MDICDEINKGLSVVSGAKDSSIGVKDYEKLVDLSFAIILTKKTEEDLEGFKVDALILKQGYAGLVGFILEGGKMNVEADRMKQHLSELNFEESRATYFAERFEESKKELSDILKTTTFTFPNVVNAEWRLDFYIKSNSLEKVNEAMYHIRLFTQENQQSYEQTSSGPNTKKGEIEFCANGTELLDFYRKLQDACKQFERLAAQ